MKTIFIINPKAGNGKHIASLKSEIKEAAEKLRIDTEIYFTKAVGDAKNFVKKYCERFGAARFIACGGDGTLSEVVNGAVGYENAEIGIVPIGTGNDFSRNFPQREKFLSVEKQLTAKAEKCDAIKYSTEVNKKSSSGYCINMFNIGFDCNVADMTNKIKSKRFITGTIAYLFSIFAILIRKKGANLKLDLDGAEYHKGPLLLTSIANGSFCGGGINSNPLAEVNDGYINVNVVYNISRLNFLTKLPFYMKGTHIKLKNIDKVIANRKCRKISITPLNNSMRLCIDGEITDAGKTEFEIVPNALNFIVP